MFECITEVFRHHEPQHLNCAEKVQMHPADPFTLDRVCVRVTFLTIFVVNSDLNHSCGFGPQNRHVLSVLLPHGADLSQSVIRPPQFTP